MEPARWQRIERLYHSALAVEESQRPSFLTGTCGGDQTLRYEEAALLSGGRGLDGAVRRWLDQHGPGPIGAS